MVYQLNDIIAEKYAEGLIIHNFHKGEIPFKQIADLCEECISLLNADYLLLAEK